jgi:hypothetical protein
MSASAALPAGVTWGQHVQQQHHNGHQCGQHCGMLTSKAAAKLLQCNLATQVEDWSYHPLLVQHQDGTQYYG